MATSKKGSTATAEVEDAAQTQQPGDDAAATKAARKKLKKQRQKAKAKVQASSTADAATAESATESESPGGKRKSQSLNDMDALFNDAGAEVRQKKKNKLEAETAAKEERVAAAKASAKAKAGQDAGATWGKVDGAKPVRFDDQLGLQIYTEEALGISAKNSGNTPDCPFDCNCCF